VFARSSSDRYWLYWIAANLVLATALGIYLVWPVLPVHLASIPNALLVLGFALRHAAARSFAGRSVSPWPFALAPLLVASTFIADGQSVTYTLANVVLAAQAGLVAWEFWRDRGDRLLSRMGLVSVYLLMALSFAVRAGQGLLAADQVQSYIPYDTMLEIHLLVALIHVIAGGFFVLSLASECSAEALREAARRDPLTGLLNRRAFETLLARLLGRNDVGLAVVDVDHFKSVNDRYGHAAGDLVLKSVSRVLLEVVGEHGHVARIGGEEFALVLVGVDAARAAMLAEAARRAVQGNVVDCAGTMIEVTVSIGVAHASHAGKTADAFLESADRALYRAKGDGRNICAAGPEANWTSPVRPAPARLAG